MAARQGKVEVIAELQKLRCYLFLKDNKQWDTLYQSRNRKKPSQGAMEWYLLWEEFGPPNIMPLLQSVQSDNAQPISILIPGCGDSNLSESLYLNGFKNITNIDYSEELIKLMKEKHKQKEEMHWITKDILTPLETPPVLVPKFYDVILDKGCFDYICAWGGKTMQNWQKYVLAYLFQVKHLLGDKGKYIVITRLLLDDTLATLYSGFWCGWKVTVQRDFSQPDPGEKVVLVVVERCTDGFLHKIDQEDGISHREDISLAKQNDLISKYMKRAKSKEEFERSFRDKGPEACCEVNIGAYRIIVLINIDRFPDTKNVDVFWVPEDDLVFCSDALTDSTYWQLEHYFSTKTKSSALLFIVLSPTLQLLHQGDDTLMDRIRLGIKPLLEVIGPEIQLGWLKMWDKEDQKRLKEISFLPPPPPKSKRPAPLRSTSSNDNTSRKGSQQSSTSKGKEKLEKDDKCEEKKGDDCEIEGLNTDQSVVAVGNSDNMADVDAVDESTVTVGNSSDQKEKGSMIADQKPPSGFPTFDDGDAIPYYPQPFTIAAWLEGHLEKEDRWLGEYAKWNDILPQVECPRLPRRESLRIMQSVITGLLDYHERYGPHEGLHDWTNIMITQVVLHYIGSKTVRFEAKILPLDRVTTLDDEDLVIRKKRGDMQNVMQILDKVLEGETKNSEFQYLSDLLFEYPSKMQVEWKNALLINYPAFWDGLERSAFLVTLYFHLVSNFHGTSSLRKALHRSGVTKLPCWKSFIPQNTVFEQVLHSAPNQPLIKKFEDGNIIEVIRYMRGVLHHFREREGMELSDVRYIEAALSILFDNYVVSMYYSMCCFSTFL